MFCPNCGVENPITAEECRRCHMAFTDEDRAQAAAQAAAQPGASLADDQEEATHVDPNPQGGEPEGVENFGTVCRRCEAFNEPGVPNCTNCGYDLTGGAAEPEAHGGSPSVADDDPGGEERTPAQGVRMPPEHDTSAEQALDTTPPSGQAGTA